MYKIRKEIITNDVSNTIKNYSKLFMSPYPIIEIYELELITNVIKALPLIDAGQLTEDNCVEYAQYFSKEQLDQGKSFSVLQYVCGVLEPQIRRNLFLSLDFNNIQYYRLSAARKKEIIEKMDTSFDFSDVSEQVLFMTNTMCSQVDFEKSIKKHIENGTFDEINEKNYANYVKKVKRVSTETISNLCSLRYIYAMPHVVLNKLFDQKKYTYYVASKTKQEGRFTFEQERIGELESAYKTIILSKEGGYENTKIQMAKDSRFISYMAHKKYYTGTTPYTRKWFAFCMQTIELLQDLFDNYEDDFIIEYLRTSGGFKNRESAVYFIERIKANSAVAADDDVYENNHHRLIDGPLKTSYTMTHKNAKRKK